MLESDERAAADDYDSCNEDETAWARAGLVLYIYIYIHVHIYIYIYKYINTERGRNSVGPRRFSYIYIY